MTVEFKNGKIIEKVPFSKKVAYDVANNLISAQFDGRGAISKYAVMNKFSVFSAYYTLISVDGVSFDWNAKKTVEMVGKQMIISFQAKDFDMVINQFLDQKTNCIYVENKVTAKKDMDFRDNLFANNSST